MSFASLSPELKLENETNKELYKRITVLRWDEEFCGNSISIQKEGKLVISRIQGWSSVIGKQGYSKGIVEVDCKIEDISTSPHIFIGVSAKDAQFTFSCPTLCKLQWTLWLNYNEYRGLTKPTDPKLKEFPKVKNGDLITLRIDCDRKTLAYGHNGTMFPVAYNDLELPVYPFVSLYLRGFGSIELIKISSIKQNELSTVLSK